MMDEQGLPRDDGRRPDDQETSQMPMPSYGASYGTPQYGAADAGGQYDDATRYGRYGGTSQYDGTSQYGQYGADGTVPQYGVQDAAPQPQYGAQSGYGATPQYGAQSPYTQPQYTQPQYGAAGSAPYNAMPLPPQGDGGQYGWSQPPQPQKWNGLAIAGFIVSFFFALVGLILSIIGLNQTKERNEKGRGLAIAGIVISIVNMVVALLLMVGLISFGGAVVDQGLDAAASQSQSQQAPDGTDSRSSDGQGGGLSDELTDDPSDDLPDDLADDLYDSTGDMAVDLFGSVQEFVESPYFQSELEGLLVDAGEAGVTFTCYADGDTLVLDYAVDDAYGALSSELAATMDEGAADYQAAADGLGMMCRTDGPAQLRVYMHTVGGQSMFDRTFTEGQ